MAKLRILPRQTEVTVPDHSNLLEVLRQSGVHLDAPCGGQGTCGKCRVYVNGKEALACRTTVCADMTVTIPADSELQVLQTGIAGESAVCPVTEGYLLAIDIGTTSVVCVLLDGTGRGLAVSGMGNPQRAFGADVISRIRAALDGKLGQLTGLIREGVTGLIQKVCGEVGIHPDEIRLVSLVGNPAMQQLFLGISPENLAAMPFAPVLTEAKQILCGDILPVCPGARLLMVPDISGYVGADTMGCILSAGLHQKEENTLLVDIGTNGEMVLGSKARMIACAAAAGPALEGAGIHFGMRASEGAIDHVWLEKGKLACSVIGGGEARGICGSGLIDAVAVCLELGLLNKRGRIQNEQRIIPLSEHIFLTQEDIRQVQLAKGAICAGIRLMAERLDIQVADIRKVLLAGAFGSSIDPENACRIGLLPEELSDRIGSMGNAALSGAKMLALDRELLPQTQELAERIEFLELASLPEFPKTFAKAMNFREGSR